jgi:hypothetical protein
VVEVLADLELVLDVYNSGDPLVGSVDYDLL